MKSTLLIISACFFTLISNGQNVDFDSLQHWKGDVLDFDWKQNEISLNQNSSGSSLIYFEANWKEDAVFNCNVSLPFSPSNNNSFELLISTDSLFATPHLISFKVGESGTSDGFDIFKDNVLKLYNYDRNWGNGGSGTISISYKNDSLVFFEKFSQDTIRRLGALYSPISLNYIGLNCKYTKSNATKFNFNDLYFGVEPVDSIPPFITSLEVNSKNEIVLCFNERIKNNRLDFNPTPSSVVLLDSSIVLNYSDSRDFTLNIIDSIHDVDGNTLMIDTFIFINYLNQYDLIITEVMAAPDASINLLSDEYVELYNRSGQILPMRSIVLWVDGVSEILPDTVLTQNEYLVIYPKKALLNSGSEIKIISNNQSIHQVDYNLDWYKDAYKQSGGWSLEMIDVTKPCLKINNWEASGNFDGGTPGVINSVNGILEKDIVFELDHVFPINDTTLQITFNYEIQNETVLDSIIIDNLSVYQLLYESNEITVSTDHMKVDSIYNLRINQTINSCWDDGIFDGASFKFSLPTISKKNDLIINEILFDPDVSGSDFIEILNNSSNYYNLSKLQFGSLDENGKITDVHFLSKEDKLISPSETVAFTEDLDWVKQQFNESGRINYANLPSCNNSDDVVLLISTQGIIIDSLSYSDTWHYSELNSTENISLERISPNLSNNSTNWFSASSSSGYGTPGLPNSTMGKVIEEHENVFIEHNVITPNNDGVNDFLRIHINMKEIGWIGSIQVINSLGIVIHTLAPNMLFGASDRLIWDCSLITKSTITAGIYVLFIQMIHPESERKINKKITFYINREVL